MSKSLFRSNLPENTVYCLCQLLTLIDSSQRPMQAWVMRLLASSRSANTPITYLSGAAPSNVASKPSPDSVNTRMEPLPFSVLKLDVTSDADIPAAFEEVASKHNHLDVLVNNAGITTDNIDQPGSPSLRATFQGTFDTTVVHREQDGKTVEGSIDGCNNTHLRLTNQQC
jgi:NAD(P)-dependent dehydrogenase (short-subunit alcohol dehydrogenase family)